MGFRAAEQILALSLSLSLSLYIYIYIEREREFYPHVLFLSS